MVINGDLNDLRLYSEEQARTQFEACPDCGNEKVERAWSVFHSKQGGSSTATLPPCATPT